MFDDPNMRAMQLETAECVRRVALAGYELQLAREIEQAVEKARSKWESDAEAESA